MEENSKASHLRLLAQKAAQNSYSPYSKAKVGSAVLTEGGKYFSGCNVENSSYGNTLCAERVAIFNAVSQGEKRIVEIYIYSEDGWPPCGSCRQVMTEFARSDLKIVIGNGQGQETVTSLKDLLPLSFGPEHLLKK